MTGSSTRERVPRARNASAGDKTTRPASHEGSSLALLGLQRSAGNGAVAAALGGGGVPLERGLREQMEERLGHDLSGVRVHDGPSAAESARALEADAFTVGRDVVFGAGRFAPDTVAGRSLLAHELAHVVQQRLITDPLIQVGPQHDGWEQAAGRVAAGETTTLAPMPATAPALQRQPAATASPRPQQTGPRRPEVTAKDRGEMTADVEAIIGELSSSFFTDEWKIVGIILKWSERDRVYQEQTGYPGTDYLDAFLLETKKRAYSRRTAGSAYVEHWGIVYEDVWHELAGQRLRTWRETVAKSKKQGTDGPREGPPENFWKTLSKQEAIGLWGVLKGMGTTAAGGLVDAPAKAIVEGLKAVGVPAEDPASAAAWLQKQYDISGEAMFDKEWTKGDPLFLGLTAADIGTAGGAVIWQLVMLGRGPGGAAWATKALQALGILGSLEGVRSAAAAIAKIVMERQAAGREITAGSLANDPQFRRECTNLVANIVATMSAAAGAAGGAKPDAAAQATIAAWKAAGLIVSSVELGERLGTAVQIGLGPQAAADKDKAIAQVLEEAITAAIQLGHGVAEHKAEAAAKTQQQEQQQKQLPPPGQEEQQQKQLPPPGQEQQQLAPPEQQQPKQLPPATTTTTGETEPVQKPAVTGGETAQPETVAGATKTQTQAGTSAAEVEEVQVPAKTEEATKPGPQQETEAPAKTAPATAGGIDAELKARIDAIRAKYGAAAADPGAVEQQLKSLEKLAAADPQAARDRLDRFDEALSARQTPRAESEPEANLGEEEIEARESGLAVEKGLAPDVTTTEKLEAKGKQYDVEKIVPPGEAARAAGNVMDDIGRFGASPDRVSELYIEHRDGRRTKLDAYEPNKEIISRKSGETGQLGKIDYLDALNHLQELRVKYSPGSKIADVPTTPPELRGKTLSGQLVLEVPPQEAPIPDAVLKAAADRNIVIRDWLGKVYKADGT